MRRTQREDQFRAMEQLTKKFQHIPHQPKGGKKGKDVPKHMGQGMNLDDYELITWGEFDALMHQILRAPGTAMPPSETREPRACQRGTESPLQVPMFAALAAC